MVMVDVILQTTRGRKLIGGCRRFASAPACTSKQPVSDQCRWDLDLPRRRSGVPLRPAEGDAEMMQPEEGTQARPAGCCCCCCQGKRG